MPKKSKNTARENGKAAPAADGIAASPKRPLKSTSSAVRKSGRKKNESASKTRPSKLAKKMVEPGDDAIRLRAYFIAERRIGLSLPGNASADWVEARRQLLVEAGLN